MLGYSAVFVSSGHPMTHGINAFSPMIQQQIHAQGANVVGLAVREAIGLSDLLAYEIGNATNAEVRISIGDRYRDLPIRHQLTRS